MGQGERAADSDILSVPRTAAAPRTQVDRLLEPKNDITLSSLQRAAAMVGRRVTIELV
jgi:hypothetical protein